MPPIILIGLVIGSILGGLATPTEAAGVGALGAIVLGFINLVLLPSLGGDELVVGTVDALGLGSRLSCCCLLDLFWWRHSLKLLSSFRESS
ncbi:MAG: hypothetical protein ACR2OW_06040 [Methyloligellaceae bacterium]